MEIVEKMCLPFPYPPSVSTNIYFINFRNIIYTLMIIILYISTTKPTLLYYFFKQGNMKPKS